MSSSTTSRSSTLLLFDVDGTLTKPRNSIDPSFYSYLMSIKPKVTLGLVGGSDLGKILEQMGGEEALSNFDYIFSENGLVAYSNGQLIGTESIQNFMGEEKLQKFINFALGYMSKIELPCKRGTFIEFRKGMINVCPVGRSCSQEERDQFEEFDKIHSIRSQFVTALKNEFPHLGLQFLIGGQISFDVFPDGWDKTFCLKFLDKHKTIHFFGDKTDPGQNDHAIFKHERTIGHSVKGPSETRDLVEEIVRNLEQ